MEKTQQSVLKHHGGDGDKAREMITQSYERRHDVAFWECWNETMSAAIEHDTVLLDIGAGIGQFVEDLALRYPDNRVIGLEVAEYMYVAQKKLPENGRLLKDDVTDSQAQIVEGSVSAVMANMVLHEMEQPVSFLNQIVRWMKSGGRVMVIDLVRQPLADYLEHKFPDGEIWGQNVPENSEIEEVFHHFLEHNRYHIEDVEYLFDQAGFDKLYSEPKGRMHQWVFEKR